MCQSVVSLSFESINQTILEDVDTEVTRVGSYVFRNILEKLNWIGRLMLKPN